MKDKDDPIFQDIPWEFIFDEHGELIGEVYLALPDPPTRKRKSKHKSWEADDYEVGSF